ncbi:MAG: thymidylate kinase, partial [Methylocella sp.]
APDRFEREDLPFHESLRAAFRSIAATEPRRCIVIDAAGAEEEVAQAIFEAVSNRLLAPAVVKQVRHG